MTACAKGPPTSEMLVMEALVHLHAQHMRAPLSLLNTAVSLGVHVATVGQPVTCGFIYPLLTYRVLCSGTAVHFLVCAPVV